MNDPGMPWNWKPSKSYKAMEMDTQDDTKVSQELGGIVKPLLNTAHVLEAFSVNCSTVLTVVLSRPLEQG
jgi:hypothetical protein